MLKSSLGACHFILLECTCWNSGSCIDRSAHITVNLSDIPIFQEQILKETDVLSHILPVKFNLHFPFIIFSKYLSWHNSIKYSIGLNKTGTLYTDHMWWSTHRNKCKWDFPVSPYDSPRSWPSVQGHCAPWRLLLWRWELAGSHLSPGAWVGKKMRVGVMHFLHLSSPSAYCDWRGVSQLCELMSSTLKFSLCSDFGVILTHLNH